MWVDVGMTRYADPQRCPDCRGPLGRDAVACPTCGLPLRGVTAAELFRTLSTADVLLTQLRASASVPSAAVPSDPVPSASVPGGGLLPGAASGPGGAAAPGRGVAGSVRPHGLSAASVPKILLGLGALCLLVAALVFLAVTWSMLGVGGRTVTLVGFTAVAAGLSGWMCRRDLRGAAEALSLVALGLLTLDLFGARAADWFGDVSTPAFLVVLGGLLAAGGVSAALLARRTPTGGLVAPEIVAGAGVAILTAGVAELDASRAGLLLVVAAVLAGGAAWASFRGRLRFTATVAAIAASFAWLAQLLHALDSVSAATFGALWGRGEVVQLLVSATLAGALVLVRDLPTPGRVAGGALGLAVLGSALTLPSFDESGTVLTGTGLVVLGAAAALTWLLPRPWGLTAALTQGLASLGVLLALATILTSAALRFGDLVSAGWGGSPGDLLPPATDPEQPAPWLAPLVVLALLLTGAALARAAAVLGDVVSAMAEVRVGVPLVAAAAVATLVSYPVPAWTVLAALLVLAAGFLRWWHRSTRVTTLLVAAGFLGAAVAVGAYDEWFTVAATTAALLAAGLVHLRAVAVETAVVAGALAPAVLAGDAWAWGALAGAAGTWTALVGLLLLAAAALSLPLYPVSWWTCGTAAARTGVEAGAAAAALPLALAGVLSASASSQATWVAVYLTVAGVAVVAQSLLRADRRPLAWPGGGLLVLASWVRLGDLGVSEPEPYTLPAALALGAVGVLRLRRDPRADTLGAVGPGLGLALTPSLLWALDEPMTLRGLLLGLTCLSLVLLGLRGRWSAPLVLGGGAGAVLVVRMAAPYIGDAVPRWALIGAAGALLIATGVTWERRLHDARNLAGYVRSLR